MAFATFISWNRRSRRLSKYLAENTSIPIWRPAAAYLYHIVSNHPFVDGNKRTGLAAAIVFLDLNGMDLIADPEEVAELVISVAAGKGGKDEVAGFIRGHIMPTSESSP
jgi:death-on-curing family protein